MAAPGMARDRSASANTTSGDFPPSSSDTRFRLPAAAWMICRPVGVDPVNATLSTPGCSARAAPALSPKPVTMFTTPSGRPASVSSSPRRSATRLASSAGLSTIVQPVASTGAIFQMALLTGRFHGTIAATTPTGSLRV